MTDDLESIKARLENSRNIVVLTGSGISQESGIPTFRGKNGLWKSRHDETKLATIDAFYDNPKLVWEWYNYRRKNILNAKPNSGHVAIAELERYAKVVVLTQNIDGLHQKAGSSHVLELHGSIVKIKCTSCNFKDEILTEFLEVPPLCECGSMLRPDVVWFGESLPQDVWQKARTAASQCDLMLIIGTSLAVMPANTLPDYARYDNSCSNAFLIEVNPELTEMSSRMDLSIQAKSSVVLPRIVSLFRKAYKKR